MYRKRFHDRKPRDNFEEVADMARSAYRIGLEIKDTINTEHKQFVVAQTSTSVTWSGLILAIVQAMAQGDDSNQRIGDSIKCQNLTLRWYAGPSLSNSNHLRVIVFWDESNVINTPAQLLNAVGTAQGVISGKTYDNRFLTKILYDEVVTLLDPDFTLGHTFMGPIKHHVIKLNKHTQFDTGTTTIVTGALKIFAISDTAAGTPITFNAQLSYTDD